LDQPLDQPTTTVGSTVATYTTSVEQATAGAGAGGGGAIAETAIGASGDAEYLSVNSGLVGAAAGLVGAAAAAAVGVVEEAVASQAEEQYLNVSQQIVEDNADDFEC
jgi:hypothetical protein